MTVRTDDATSREGWLTLVVQARQTAKNAGASVVAVHARRPDDGATSNAEIYRNINQRVRAKCDIVIDNSTGGVHGDMIAQAENGYREILTPGSTTSFSGVLRISTAIEMVHLEVAGSIRPAISLLHNMRNISAGTADLHQPILPLCCRLLCTVASHYLIVSAAALHTNAS